MAETADSVDIEHLAELVAGNIGVRFSEARRGQITSSIGRVMAAHGIDAGNLLQRLSWDQGFIEDITAAMAVGETHFFRGAEQFAFIRDEIIPELCGRRSGARPIRICSVGCSTGEEPYSLALLCEESGISGEVRIAAVDVCREALVQAKQGEYDAWSLRNVAPVVRQRYFTSTRGRFRLNNSIARQVEFGFLNVAARELSWPGSIVADFDLVLCRNVLVHHEPETVRRIASHLLGCLSRGGWLVTAPVDPLLSKVASFEAVTTHMGVVYRRPLITRLETMSRRNSDLDGRRAIHKSRPQKRHSRLHHEEVRN